MYPFIILRLLLASIFCKFVLSHPASAFHNQPALEARTDYQPTLAELQQTALAFVMDLKTANLAGEVKVLLVGGTAIWNNFPTGRTTKDVDFMVESLRGAPPPKSLKELLLRTYPTRYKIAAGEFVYVLAPNKLIGIDAVDVTMEHPSIRPTGLKSLNTITSASTLPWIEDQEILILKMQACSERDKQAKRISDASDVVALIGKMPKPINLTDAQKKAIDHPEVWKKLAQGSTKSEDWFKTELGVRKSRSSSPSASDNRASRHSQAGAPRTPSPMGNRGPKSPRSSVPVFRRFLYRAELLERRVDMVDLVSYAYSQGINVNSYDENYSI